MLPLWQESLHKDLLCWAVPGKQLWEALCWQSLALLAEVGEDAVIPWDLAKDVLVFLKTSMKVSCRSSCHEGWGLNTQICINVFFRCSKLLRNKVFLLGRVEIIFYIKIKKCIALFELLGINLV